MVAMWSACKVSFYFVVIFGISVPTCSAGLSRHSAPVLQNDDPLRYLAAALGYRPEAAIPAQLTSFFELPPEHTQTNNIRDAIPSSYGPPTQDPLAPIPNSRGPPTASFSPTDRVVRPKPNPSGPVVFTGGDDQPRSVVRRHPTRTIVHHYDDVPLTPMNNFGPIVGASFSPTDPVVPLRHPSRTVVHEFDDGQRRARQN